MDVLVSACVLWIFVRVEAGAWGFPPLGAARGDPYRRRVAGLPLFLYLRERRLEDTIVG